ncbi:MAG: hypothetical protein JW944_03915 [Deltaproteobacteria bacterium]|nr:hypothetical protein [Deltaproteobacteria bacterium]
MYILFKRAAMWLFRRGGRFLFHWSAFSGLFITTSNCPCCGQPACPTGAAIIGILAIIPATVIGFFRKRPPLSVSSDQANPSSDK